MIFVSSYTSRLLRKAEIEQEIVAWEQRVDEAEFRRSELQAELDYVNSPAYLEEAARDQLDMAREGDTVIIVVPTGSTLTPGDSEVDGDNTRTMDSGGSEMVRAMAGSRDSPTWRQWIALFAGEE